MRVHRRPHVLAGLVFVALFPDKIREVVGPKPHRHVLAVFSVRIFQLIRHLAGFPFTGEGINDDDVAGVSGVAGFALGLRGFSCGGMKPRLNDHLVVPARFVMRAGPHHHRVLAVSRAAFALGDHLVVVQVGEGVAALPPFERVVVVWVEGGRLGPCDAAPHHPHQHARQGFLARHGH